MDNIENQAQKVIEKVVEELYRMIHDNANLTEKIFSILGKYLNDKSCPSDFLELEKALERLNPNLSGLIRNLLINIDIISTWEHLEPEMADFLRVLQENYAYKYRVTAFNTVLIGDKNNWYNASVKGFNKNGNPHYGISIVRNDGEYLYFDGQENSINRLISIIQDAMEKARSQNQED